MFYDSWMSYIKDDAKITKIAMPGSHNSATKNIFFLGRCQNGTVLEQYEYGVRDFCIRIKYKHGKLYAAHGLATGMPADELFASLGEIVNKYDDFFFIDLKPYPNQGIVGPISINFDGDPALVDKMIEKYLNPAKYALTNTDDLKNLTLGDIRKSGKKFVIYNDKKLYKYSCNFDFVDPWDPTVFGYKPNKFAKECLKYLKDLNSDGFFRFQTQLTPGFGTENGITKWPISLEKIIKPYFSQITTDISKDPVMLEKVNFISGDFMTADYSKANEILYLNLLKGIVKPELEKEYSENIRRK